MKSLEDIPGVIVKEGMLSFGPIQIPPLQSITVSTMQEHSGNVTTNAARAYTIDENDLVAYLFVGHCYGMRKGMRLQHDTPIVLQTLSEELIPGWTVPGDVDLVEFRWQNETQLDLDLTTAIEIKRVLVNSTGELKSGRYGTTQARGLVKMGFRNVTLVHLVLQEPRYGPDGKSYLHTTGPSLKCYERIQNKPQLKALRDEGINLAMIGLGQHPEASFLSAVDFTFDYVSANPVSDTPEIVENRKKLELGLSALVTKIASGKMQMIL